jgi:fructose-6-phosphate aldolase 2
MEILLDTANISAIKKYNDIYNITGVTTNPVILSREGGEFFPTLYKIKEIIKDKELHVQVTAETSEEMVREAESIVKNLGKDVFIKVPVNEVGIKTIKVLKESGYRVTATVIYTLQQAIFASSVDADYVAPYFNHICDHIGNASAVIAEMSKIFKNHNKSTKILAASFRNTTQVLESFASGAEAVTLSPEMLSAMLKIPTVDATISKFSQAFADMYGEKKIYEL